MFKLNIIEKILYKGFKFKMEIFIKVGFFSKISIFSNRIQFQKSKLSVTSREYVK